MAKTDTVESWVFVDEATHRAAESLVEECGVGSLAALTRLSLIYLQANIDHGGLVPPPAARPRQVKIRTSRAFKQGLQRQASALGTSCSALIATGLANFVRDLGDSSESAIKRWRRYQEASAKYAALRPAVPVSSI